MTGMVERAANNSMMPIATAPPAAPARTASHARRFIIAAVSPKTGIILVKTGHPATRRSDKKRAAALQPPPQRQSGWFAYFRSESYFKAESEVSNLMEATNLSSHQLLDALPGATSRKLLQSATL